VSASNAAIHDYETNPMRRAMNDIAVFGKTDGEQQFRGYVPWSSTSRARSVNARNHRKGEIAYVDAALPTIPHARRQGAPRSVSATGTARPFGAYSAKQSPPMPVIKGSTTH
jgi:hypothetical protein